MLEHEVAFLFELRGHSPGVAQGLTRDVFRIGSDMENDLIMKDPGIALYQAEIRLELERFVIRNFSVEGAVFLNGESFEEATLRKGDILTLGDSMYRFVPQGEAMTQEELWRPVGGKRPAGKAAAFSPIKRLSFLGALTVLGLGVILYIALSQTPRRDPLAPVKTGRATPSPRTDPRALSALYDRGLDLLSTRHWDRALVVFQRVQKEAPNYKELDRLVQQGFLESAAAQRLNLGKGMLIEGSLGPARAELSEIPEASLMYREAEKLIREIDQKMVQVQIQRARTEMARKNWISARGEVEAVLQVDPANEEARTLLRQIERMEGTPGKNWYFSRRRDTDEGEKSAEPAALGKPKRMEPEKAPAPRPGAKAPSASASAVPEKPAVAARKRPSVNVAPTLRRARTAYVKGDTDRSLSDLERILQSGAAVDRREEASRLVQDVGAAKNFFHQAEILQREGRTAEALEIWERFLEKDRAVAGSEKSEYFRKASVLLSRIYYRRGQEAFDQDHIVPAARFWRMAQRIDPSNEDVKSGIRRLSESAQKYYREGYSLQAINPPGARAKWEVVMQIVPPDDPYYQKAKQQIEQSAAIP